MDTTNIQTLHTIVVDSVEYIRRTDVVDFYSDLADKQATQFSILITVLLGIIALWIGATWWWNYRASKLQIKEDIAKEKELLLRMFKTQQNKINSQLQQGEKHLDEIKASLQKSLNEQIESKTSGMKEGLHKEMDLIDSKYKKAFEEFEHKINIERAETQRLFALHCSTTGDLYNALDWAIHAVETYNKAHDDVNLGQSISIINNILSTSNTIHITENKRAEWIGIIQDNVPPVMNAAKQYILMIIKTLPPIII